MSLYIEKLHLSDNFDGLKQDNIDLRKLGLQNNTLETAIAFRQKVNDIDL